VNRDARAKHAAEREERLRRANLLIEKIASCGRKFFRNEDDVSHFEIAKGGHLYFVDKYTYEDLPTFGYTNTHRWLRYFTEGSTLKAFVLALANDYIVHGHPIPTGMLLSDRDRWAYGAAMDEVRDLALELGIWAPTAPDATPAHQEAEDAS